MSIALAAIAQASVQDLPRVPRPIENGPPQATDARVVLSFDKATFLLGENVLVHYCLENASATPFRIQVGGDYEGASRSTRFQVTVTSADGTVLPAPASSSLGGISITPTVGGGQQWCQSLQLMRYARIDDPGTYTVRVTHDLGWRRGTAPEGRASIALAMPNPAEARRVVAETLALPPSSGLFMDGQKATPTRDLSTLRYGVYLPVLLPLAQAGNREAVVGIGAIPTPAATRALIALLAHTDHALALDAAGMLAMRLPDPGLDGTLPRRSPFGDGAEGERRYLRDASWQPEMGTLVREAATTWLGSQNVQDVIQGAFMLEAVGDASSGPALLAALDRALDRTRTAPAESDVYPRPRGAMQELMRAADVMVARGYVPPVSPATAGEAALWLAAFGRGARPAGWQDRLHDLLAHPIPYVRELALQRVPPDATPALFSTVGLALQSSDMDVQIAASDLVQRAKLTTFRPDIEALLREATDFMVMNAARNALYVVGGRAAVMEIAADRIADPSKLPDTMRGLFGLFEGAGGTSSGPVSPTEAEALSARWKRFLAAHRAEIDSGTRFSLDDPVVTPDLIPSSWAIMRPGLPNWPSR